MKTATILAPAAAVMALALAGCGSTRNAATAAGPQSCFNAALVSNYAVVDRETVNLRVGAGEYYQIKLLGVCPDIKWSDAIALESVGSSQVCTGLALTIHAPGPTGPQQCAADSIRRLGADEVAALPAGQKP
ncbi:MAG: hypothetical protein JNL56_04475 [Alphaproteobacteria bacterium]|nr:hypothetical protein [Alphaproteobacteria bacterium]